MRAIRKARGLDIKDAAEIVGIHSTSISKIENDRCNVTISTLKRFATAYGVKIEDFFRDDIKEIR
jgi:transcriptional regulator with XRE-family HTH domain